MTLSYGCGYVMYNMNFIMRKPDFVKCKQQRHRVQRTYLCRLIKTFVFSSLEYRKIIININNNNNNNNNNSLYFQRVTHLAKKKLIFHEALYELPPKNDTSIEYKDDLHVYKIIRTSWNTFKPYIHTGILFYISIIYIIPLDTSD